MAVPAPPPPSDRGQLGAGPPLAGTSALGRPSAPSRREATLLIAGSLRYNAFNGFK